MIAKYLIYKYKACVHGGRKAAERKTHQDLSLLIKDHAKNRDTDNFVYIFSWMAISGEPVQRNFV
jgi:hypothetical protein